MIKKILLGLLAIILLAAVSFYFYVQSNWNIKYDLAGPALKTSTDSAIIARGRYLVKGPAHCVSCHVSTYEEMIQSDQGAEVPLKGGVLFPMGPLGIMSPPNLTPDPTTGIGRYTDAQLFRMMRHAIKPDSTSTMSLLMPFWNMADEDLVAIVSYLRSMEPVENQVQKPQWTFVGKAVRALAPTFRPIENPTPLPSAPPMAPTIERGEYLARYVANCVGCHTQRDQMTYEAIGPEYAGGMEFEPFPELYKALNVDMDTWIRTPNITPHPNSALSKYTSLEEWIARFRKGRIVSFSPMDWGPFSRMSEEDLAALWNYLQSLEPIDKDPGPLVFKKD